MVPAGVDSMNRGVLMAVRLSELALPVSLEESMSGAAAGGAGRACRWSRRGSG